MAFVITLRHTYVSGGANFAATGVTGSATPTANSLFLTWWASHASSNTNNPAVQTPVGGGYTYAQIQKLGESPAILWETDAIAGRIAGAFYRAAVGASPSAHTVTVDSYSGTDTACYGVACCDITGHDTASPIVQSKINGASVVPASGTASGTVTLDATPTSGSLIVVSLGVSDDGGVAPASPTAGAGKTFTSLYNPGNQPLQPALFYRIADGTESATITSADLGGTVGNYIMSAVEVRAAGAGFSGSAALSGSGSLSFPTQISQLVQTVDLSGSGTLSPGSILPPGPLYGAQLGTPAAQPGDFQLGTTLGGIPVAALSGSGTLSFAAVPKPIQTVNLSGSGSLSFAAVPAISGATALSGSGTLSFAAVPKPVQTVNLSGSGTLSFAAVPKPVQTVNLSGSGTLVTAGAMTAPFIYPSINLYPGTDVFPQAPLGVILSGSGALSFVAAPKPVQAFNLSGSGTLSLIAVSFRSLLGSLSPVAWWRLEEISGTTAADSAGTNPGTYTGTPTLGTTGLAPIDPINLAVDFTNNALRYVEVAHASALNPVSLSITALIDPASINGNNRIYEKGLSDSGVALKVEGTNLELRINGHVTVDHPLSRLGTGRRFIVGTYDSATGRGTLFVDGRPVATAVGTSGAAPAPADPLRIGQKPGGTTNADGWNGKLQHVALFDRVLTNTEIADLGDRAIVEPDYVWWKNELWTLANRGVFSPYVNSFSGKRGRIDDSGYLHLNVENAGGGNSVGTEVASVLGGRGYGTYTVQVGSQVSGVHPNVVFGGMFTYGADASYGHREIDACEQSAWSGATGPWTLGHVVWAPSSSSDPEATRGGYDAADITTLTDSSQTTVMIWAPGSITFRTYHGLSTASGDLFRESVVTAGQVVTFDIEGGGSYTGPILLPVPEDERVHFNLWVCPNYSGTSDPATVTNTDIIIRDFSFESAAVGAVNLSGSGTLTVPTRTPTPIQTVNLSGSGTLTFPTQIPTPIQTANLSGSGTLSLVGTPGGFVGSVALSGSGTLTFPTQIPKPVQTVNLSGSGTLSTAAVVAVSGSVALSGSGTLSFVAVPSVARTMALSGSGTLSLVGVLVSVGAVALSGSGTLTLPTRVPTPIQTVALNGSGVLSFPTQIPKLVQVVALNGSGVLSTSEAPKFITTVALNGSGALTLFGFVPTGTRNPGDDFAVVGGAEVPVQLQAVVSGVLVPVTWAFA